MHRRDLWNGGSACLAAALANSVIPPAQAAASWLDLTKTPDLFRAYARLRGNGTGKPGMWWYGGTAFGRPKDELQMPLLGIEGFSFNRLIINADGSLTQHMSETGYFKDLASGAIIDAWINPFTGKTVKPGHYHTHQEVTATAEGLRSGENGRATTQTAGRIGPAIVGADTTWITENFSVKVVMPPDAAAAPPPLVATSMATFAALTKDVQDKALDFVPASLSFQSIRSAFLPWMEMADMPGLSVWQLMGRKVRSIADCPPTLRARIDKDYAGWLADPGV